MRKARGFTLYELAVCTALVGLLSGGLLVKLRQVQTQSELVSVRQLEAAVRTALAVRSARVLAEQGELGLLALAQENPLKWLERPPINYLGELYRPPPRLIKPGHWYYDRNDRTINFLQSRDSSSSKASKLLKFKVELLRKPDPNRGGGRTGATQGLVLDRIKDRDRSDYH